MTLIPHRNSVLAAVLAVASASVLWIWAAAAAGKTEAWDGPYYFSRAVPALFAVAAVCGFFAPGKAWLWPTLMYASQFIIMIARNTGSVGPLAPLGFISMAVLAAVTMIPAYGGGLARGVWESRGRNSPGQG